MDRLYVWPGQDMKFLIVEFRYVLEISFNPPEGRISFKFVENVGLHNAKIDAASENNVFGVLKCSGASDGQNPQSDLSTSESESQIDCVIGPFRNDAD